MSFERVAQRQADLAMREKWNKLQEEKAQQATEPIPPTTNSTPYDEEVITREQFQILDRMVIFVHQHVVEAIDARSKPLTFRRFKQIVVDLDDICKQLQVKGFKP